MIPLLGLLVVALLGWQLRLGLEVTVICCATYTTTYAFLVMRNARR